MAMKSRKALFTKTEPTPALQDVQILSMENLITNLALQ